MNTVPILIYLLGYFLFWIFVIMASIAAAFGALAVAIHCVLYIITVPIYFLERIGGGNQNKSWGYLFIPTFFQTDQEALDQINRLNAQRAREAEQKAQYSNNTNTPPPKPAAPSIDPHELLGVERNSTKAQIQAAYREIIKKNHPDRVADLDPELQKFATQRSVLLRDAYEALIAKASV